MKRRNFIKLTSSASALTLLPTEIFALLKSAGMSACPINSNKKIVLIQLSGANDGLNTLVPINQYDKYASLRPNIKLLNTGANGIINLDTTLSLQNQLGLHPALTGFKSLYESGFMRIIQGVGYPIQDKSHFKSTDLWLTGGDGTVTNNNIESGWVGRFLENYYVNLLADNYPLGIQLGSSENSLGFHGEIEHGMSLNINGQDPAGFYSVINGLGGVAPTNIPNSEYGNLLRYILDNDSSTNTYAKTISAAFNSGINSVTYPNSGLANQLKTVAKFISGGLQTKVYLVKIGGFDTHNLQVSSNKSTHTGTHANLLTQISEAVNSFIKDLNNQKIIDEVIAVTFSEFGRKIAENGNLGTDHGEVAPMFVFGSAITPGVSGTNINLNEAASSNNFQVKTVQHDYRRIFSTILQDWLGANTSTLDLTFYDTTNTRGFSNNKVNNLIKNEAKISPECYVANTLSINNNELEVENQVLIYPNPSSEIIIIKSTTPIYSVSIHSLDSKFISKHIYPNTTTEYSINVQQLSVGMYFISIQTGLGNFSKKIIIRR